MRLEEAVGLFLQAQAGLVRERTRRAYRGHLKVLLRGLGDCEVQAVTATMLRRWRAELAGQGVRYDAHPSRPREQGGLSPHTLRTYLQAARRFFDWCVSEGILDASPVAREALPRLPKQPPKGIAAEDLRRLLEAARERGPREEALVLFLADTGCRVGGLCSLTRPCLDLTRGCAWIIEKGGHEREVYFVATTAAALARWLDERPPGGSHVFVGRKGPLTPSGVYQLLKRLAREAGIAGRFNPHAFRHAAARRWIERGMDLSTASQLLGHSGVAVTAAYYARWTRQELQRRHQRFSAIDEEEDGAALG